MSWWMGVSPNANELATNELVGVSAYLSDGVRQELIIHESSENITKLNHTSSLNMRDKDPNYTSQDLREFGCINRVALISSGDIFLNDQIFE